jgi:hypothetical protein
VWATATDVHTTLCGFLPIGLGQAIRWAMEDMRNAYTVIVEENSAAWNQWSQI